MSAADIDEVGCPEPAAVVQRILSTRHCWASCFHCCTWELVSVVVISSPHSCSSLVVRNHVSLCTVYNTFILLCKTQWPLQHFTGTLCGRQYHFIIHQIQGYGSWRPAEPILFDLIRIFKHNVSVIN